MKYIITCLTLNDLYVLQVTEPMNKCPQSRFEEAEIELIMPSRNTCILFEQYNYFSIILFLYCTVHHKVAEKTFNN